MDNALARTNRPGYLAEQSSQNATVARTKEQIAAMGGVTLVVGEGIDTTRFQLEGFLNQPGRTEYHQRYLNEETASLFTSFVSSAHNLHRRALVDIGVDRQPEPQVVRVEHVYVPQQPLLKRLIG